MLLYNILRQNPKLPRSGAKGCAESCAGGGGGGGGGDMYKDVTLDRKLAVEDRARFQSQSGVPETHYSAPTK